MIREDFNDYPEPPRPQQRKAAPWVPIVLVALVGLAVAHMAGLTKPLLSLGGSHPPGWRLVGDWESDNDPVFQRVCYPAWKDGYAGTGMYWADGGRGMREVIFKVESESRSGRQVELAEYLPGLDANYRVRYSIADDGKSLTREYDGRNGQHITCQYRYVGPPTREDPAREYRP